MPTQKRIKASPKLKEEQDGFAEVMKFLSPASNVIRIGFRDAAETAAFHKAKSWNLKNYRKSPTKDPCEWLTYSLGERARALAPGIEEIIADKLKVCWGEADEALSSGEDDVMLLAVNIVSKAVKFKMHAARRKDFQAEMELPAYKAGESIDILDENEKEL